MDNLWLIREAIAVGCGATGRYVFPYDFSLDSTLWLE